MKGSLPFREKYISPRTFLFTFLLVVFSSTFVEANTIVIGAGFGYVSVTSMKGLNEGDTLAVTPGKYSGGSFGHLKGITITSNNGAVIFNGQVTLTSLVECTFSHFQFVNCPHAAIRWDGNFRRCVEKYVSFNNVVENCNDAGNDPQPYTGDTSSLKMYMCTFDSLTAVRSNYVLVGNWGVGYNNMCFMDSIVISRLKVDQTRTDGSEVRGTIFRFDCHDWKVTFSGANAVARDIGLLYVYGNGSMHDIYKFGDRGYIARLWVIGLKVPQNSYFYNNIDLNGLEYGSIDIKTEPENYTKYMTGGNTYIYNNTSGNKADASGYWCSIAVIGRYALPWICEVKNNLGFNLTTHTKPKIAMDQSDGTWKPDSANNMYFNVPDGVIDPVTGIPVANSPVIGKGLTVPWITDDFYHNPRTGANDIGAVQHGGAPLPAPPNKPPVAIADAAKTITLPVNSVTLDGTKSYDADGKIVIYNWTALDSTKSGIITSPAASSTTVTGLTAGTYIYKLVVTDDSSATASAFDTIIVKPAANIPPIANAGTSKSVILPVDSVTLDGSGSSDADGTIVSYSWAQISGVSTATLVNANQSKTTTSNLKAGQYIFELTVTDNSGASTKAQVKVNVVDSASKPPIANAGANQTITLPTNQVSLDGSSSLAPSGNIVSYTWTEGSGPSTAGWSSSSAAQTNATGLVAGTYIFYLTITDNNNAKASDSVIVTVNPAPNVLPVADAGPDQTITAPSSSVNLNGSNSSDADGTIASYAWTLVSGAGSININNGNTATPSVTGLTPGIYVFQLMVTDNSGATAKAQVTITVNPKPATPNQLPIANAGTNLTITAPTNSINLNGSSSFDPDGTIATYSWKEVSGPTTVVITGSSIPSPTVSGLVVGTYVFELLVIDNNGGSATDQVTITVNPEVNKINQMPVANAGVDTTIDLPSSSYALNAAGSYDPDGTISSYHWQQIGGPATVDASSMDNAVVDISNLQPGQYEFQVMVTDNQGAISTATVIVSVKQGTGVADQLLIYPNPAHDVLNQKITSQITGTIKISIYDMNGRLVQANQAEKSSDVLTNTFNIGTLSNGMYTILVNISNRKSMVSKFIKE